MAEFVSGSLDSLIFWDAKTFAKKSTEVPFPDAACHLSSLTWSASNSKLAVLPREGDKFAICEFQEGTSSWTHHLSHQEGVAFCSGCLLQNSRYLACGSSNSVVQIWDLKHKKIFRKYLGHTSPVVSVTRNHSDHWLVSGGQDGAIIIHSVDNSTSRQFLQSPHPQPKMAINRLRFSHVEKGQFGSAGEDGSLCVWSVESQRLLSKYSSPHAGPATDLCFSPSNNMLMISVGMDSRIKCYDIQTRKIVTEVSAPSALSSVTMLKDGSTLLAGSADGKLYLYELRSVKYPRTTLTGHQTAVTCVAQQSFSKHSRSSRASSATKGKHSSSPLSSTPGGLAENSAHLASAESSPAPSLDPPGLMVSTEHTLVTTNHTAPHDSRVSITPFVTQPASSGARANASSENLVAHSLPSITTTTAAPTEFSTPAASQRTQTSSIFSPLDPNLVTPAPTPAPSGRATGTVATTTVPPPPTTAATIVAGGGAGGVEATPNTAAALSGAPTITTTAPQSHSAPPPSAAETSTIFSPLDSNASQTRIASASSRQPVASPLLVSHHHPHHHPPERKLPPAAEVGKQQKAPIFGDSAAVMSSAGAQSSASEECDGRVGVGGAGVGGKGKALAWGQSQLADMLERQSLDYPPSQPLSSAPSAFSSLPDSATTSSGEHYLENNVDMPAAAQRGAAVAPPLIPSSSPSLVNGGGVQMKYLESIIRDAHEETLQALHQDIRALSVDNIKFFCSLQQQSAAQHAALVERMDRLSQDLKRVQEMVRQFMPKH